LGKTLQNEPAPSPQWPDWPIEELRAVAIQNHSEWLEYLNTLTDTDLDTTLTYQTFRGDTYTDTLKDIFAHVINHGTHHRGQVGVLLKQAGADLPPTDYIFYVRGL
jgi:uncharacterized damage-inducible protein DinB